MLDPQRLAVQAVSEQNGVGEEVGKRQARRVAVLTPKNHERGSGCGRARGTTIRS